MPRRPLRHPISSRSEAATLSPDTRSSLERTIPGAADHPDKLGPREKFSHVCPGFHRDRCGDRLDFYYK
ncbi:rCG49530 [Rattus norvegicus]|uniref:RCG49530 n=1 Tax=Rattus norvegicus TaxID=10116 RepID=A6J3I8_RAT|nr:rCG49530 [Rattus norvegicus]